jgi:S1-C subfamily serine protease
VPPGDVILAVNGKKIDGMEKLAALLDDQHVGDTVRLTVMRHGQPREITAKLQAGD